MKRWLAVLALIPSLLRADITQRLNVRTQDGTVNTYPYSARFTNGTLTDNGDGTVSIAITGGSGTWGSITGTLSLQTDLWTQFTAVATSTAALWTQFGAVATSTGAIYTQFGAVATSTAAIYTRGNLTAAATAQVAIDTTTIASNLTTESSNVASSTAAIITRANLAASATAQVAIDTTTLNTRGNLVAAATAQVAIDTTAVNGRIEPIYPSTGMPTFPFGVVTSSINASSNTVIAGSTFYQNGPILLASSVTISGSAGFSSTSLYGIVGAVSANNAAAGNVGEYVESVVSTTQRSAATTQYQDATSISLTAGDWDVTGCWTTEYGATVSYSEIGVSVTSGNSASGLVLGSNRFQENIASATEGEKGICVPSYRVLLATVTTVYLKWRLDFTGVVGSNYLNGARLSARRMR